MKAVTHSTAKPPAIWAMAVHLISGTSILESASAGSLGARERFLGLVTLLLSGYGLGAS